MLGLLIAQRGQGNKRKLSLRARVLSFLLSLFQKKSDIMKILLANSGDIVYKYSTHLFFLYHETFLPSSYNGCTLLTAAGLGCECGVCAD